MKNSCLIALLFVFVCASFASAGNHTVTIPLSLTEETYGIVYKNDAYDLGASSGCHCFANPDNFNDSLFVRRGMDSYFDPCIYIGDNHKIDPRTPSCYPVPRGHNWKMNINYITFSIPTSELKEGQYLEKIALSFQIWKRTGQNAPPHDIFDLYVILFPGEVGSNTIDYFSYAGTHTQGAYQNVYRNVWDEIPVGGSADDSTCLVLDIIDMMDMEKYEIEDYSVIWTSDDESIFSSLKNVLYGKDKITFLYACNSVRCGDTFSGCDTCFNRAGIRKDTPELKLIYDLNQIIVPSLSFMALVLLALVFTILISYRFRLKFF